MHIDFTNKVHDRVGMGLVLSVSASHAVGRGFAPQPGHTNGHHKNGTNCLTAWHYALG